MLPVAHHFQYNSRTPTRETPGAPGPRSRCSLQSGPWQALLVCTAELQQILITALSCPPHHPARWGSPSLFAEKQAASQRGWFSIHPHTHRTQHDVQPSSSVHLSVCPLFPPRCAQHLKTSGSGTPHLQAPRGMCCPSLFSSDSGRIRTAKTLC